MRSRRKRAAAVAMVSLLWGTANGTGSDAEHYRLDLPAEDLASALRTIAMNSPYRLLYGAELVRRKMGGALHGFYTIEEALDALLQGTGLEYRIMPPSLVVIRPAAVPPPKPPKPLTPPVRRATASAESAPAISAALSEILVTARRRDEDLQSVPISVSTFGAAELSLRSIDTTEGLTHESVNFAPASGSFFGREQASFRIRGLPDVSIYVDGIAYQEQFGILNDLVEIERVEVLRGPQGTLFGKNSLGGAVQYVTKQPADEFGGSMKLTVGSFGRLDLNASVDLPLNSTLLTKFTGAKLTRGGYLPSTSVNRRFGSQDDSVGRFDLWWKPVAGFDWKWTVESDRIGTNGDATTVWQLTPVCSPHPNLTCLYDAAGLKINPAWVYGASQQWKTASGYQGPELTTDLDKLATWVHFSPSDDWDLKALGSHRTIKSINVDDFASIPYHLFDGNNQNVIEENTAELQAFFNHDPWKGTSGLYYYTDDRRYHRSNWFQNELRIEPEYNAAALAFLGTASLPPPEDINQLTYYSIHGWAAYGEWTLRASDRWSLTAGLRYNRDTNDTKGYTPSAPIPAVCCVAAPGVQTNGGPALSTVDEVYVNTAPRLSAQYRWSDALMLYVTYAEGFNQGGGTVTAGGIVPYGPEHLRNYEIGMHGGWFDGRVRVNAALFHASYVDIQVAEDIDFNSVITNTAAGWAQGGEFEGVWSVTPDLTLRYGFGYLDTAYSRLPGDSSIIPGTPFPFAPRYSATLTAQYALRLPGGGALTLHADDGWQDSVYTGVDASRSYIPAYALLGAGITYRSPSTAWEVKLFGSNLTDRYYRLNGYTIPALSMDTGTVGRPREWGLSLGVKF